ncbi:MAG: phosphatase PAP2 family protein [Candidatus Neomarinimicrobiota bacterium]
MGLIEFLQRFDFDWLIMVMKTITFLGDENFYLLVLPVLVWVWRKRDVLPLVIILLLNFWINYELKEFFQQPRPAGVGLIAADHFGFPSGHAQGAMVLWGYLAWVLVVSNRRAVYAWFGTLIFFIGLSRLYLGVHFPQDVVGGWSIGFLVLFIGIGILKTIRVRQLEFPPVPTAMLALLAGMMLALLAPSDLSARIGGMLAGLVGAIILERVILRYETAADWWRQVLKIVIGITGIVILRSTLKMVLPELLWADWLRYLAMGVWIGLAAPWLFVRLRLATND